MGEIDIVPVLVEKEIKGKELTTFKEYNSKVRKNMCIEIYKKICKYDDSFELNADGYGNLDVFIDGLTDKKALNSAMSFVGVCIFSRKHKVRISCRYSPYTDTFFLEYENKTSDFSLKGIGLEKLEWLDKLMNRELKHIFLSALLQSVD